MFLTGVFLPNMVRKRCCTGTTDCIRAYSSIQKAPSVPVSAIFTHLLIWRPATKLSVRDMHKQT